MGLSNVVSVSISTSAPAVTKPGFGVPLVLGYHTHWSDLIRYYTTLSGMVSDGFATSDPEYLAAQAILAQNPTVQKFAIGKRTHAPTLTLKVTPTARNTTIYTITIDGVDYAITSDGSATVAEIVTALKNAIHGDSGCKMDATDNTTYLTLTEKVAGNYSTVVFKDNSGGVGGAGTAAPLFAVEDVTTDAGIATDIANIALVDASGWYAILSTFQGDLEVTALAAWVEANQKLFGFSTISAGVKTSGTSDLFHALQALGYKKTFGMWHHKPHQFSCAGWMGAKLPDDPGSETWDLVSIAGVEVSVLTDTEESNITGKNGNYYIALSGENITQDGRVFSGGWIDTERFIDWLVAELQGNVFQLQVNASAQGSKVPFTDPGIAQFEAVVRQVLDAGVAVGGLVPGSIVITVSLASSISASNKAARKLTPGIQFSAELQGAIQSSSLVGVLSD